MILLTAALALLIQQPGSAPSAPPAIPRFHLGKLEPLNACISEQANQLELSGEQADVVVRAAVAACHPVRLSTLLSIQMSIRSARSANVTPEQMLDPFQERFEAAALLAVVRKRALMARAQHAPSG